ncbi:polysaccharide deacetylase family protein [Psychrobacter arenosus]|uniref:polysaccharide deacetylase family protein n=2 Tax=Psychrobacter arenosus TaxID=256326 RepID=UPI00191A8AF6|nr:polysaccharide deacetylase family protein [Psychrobacter arenosus]
MLRNSLFSSINRIPNLQQRYSGIATIFALHRVADFNPKSLTADLNVSPKFLENFIIELKQKGYDFISIDDLYNILVNQEDVKNKVLFTLDDGYLDNYTIAYPIFKRHQVPFTVYLTTNFADHKAILWWYSLERLILGHDEIVLSDGAKYSCLNAKQHREAFKHIRQRILDLNQSNLEEELNALFSNYQIDWLSDVRSLAMDWDDVIELNKDDLATIGGHTLGHPVISQLSDEQLYDEIVLSNQIITQRINSPVEHFAYPYGRKQHASHREFDLITSLGLKTAVTTRKGNIFPEHSQYLSCLPRRMLEEKYAYYKMIKPSKVRIATD